MKRVNIKNFVIGAISLTVFWVLSMPSTVMAYNTMTVSPPTQKIILAPGETYTDSLTVSNASNSDRDLKYEVKVGSFTQNKNGSEHNDDYGTVDVISESNYNQIMNWITLNDKNGVVAPGKSEDISYTINVPEDAPAGGQYATIIVMDKTTSGNGSGNVTIDDDYQFASIIYAEVAGETKTEGDILFNNVPGFIFSSPLTAESMVKSNGNVHTDAEYTLEVWPLFSDEEICTNAEKPETSLILPETERYHAQTCDLPMVGIFKAKQTVKIFGETSVVERTVIVCPLWLLFIIIFVIVAIVIWLSMRIRGRRTKEKSE